jgi:RNA polymerase sigma factor (TIGR02999 family)
LVSVTGEGVTDLLRAWSSGDHAVREELWPLIYDELRMIAGELMKGERQGHTLQPTALVNEAYLRLVDQNRMKYEDRRHFFAMASRFMRRVLVEHARAKQRLKRDGGSRILLDVDLNLAARPNADVLELDEALARLEEMEPDKVRIVELRFFGGLTNEEVAKVMDCSEKTVRRQWQVAKLWLFRELSRTADDGS